LGEKDSELIEAPLIEESLRRNDLSDLARVMLGKKDSSVGNDNNGSRSALLRWERIFGQDVSSRAHPSNHICSILCNPKLPIRGEGDPSWASRRSWQGKGDRIPLEIHASDGVAHALDKPEIPVLSSDNSAWSALLRWKRIFG
jgi:hypothetical protein